MAMRQYIGARYVPRFLGTYDPTQQYEALDVVDNGSGTSYIARKIVPAGTPLTDTEYWFVYGASSGAIIQLQNDMIQAQNDITSIQGNIVTLQGNVLTLQGNVASNAKEIIKLGGGTKRIVMISDSYGAHPSVNNSWMKIVENKLSSFDTYSYYAGSMGFAHAGDGGYTAETLLTAHENDIPNHNTITDIIFCLGVNDYNETTSAVSTAYNNLITYVKTTYPNATIWFGFSSYSHQLTAIQRENNLHHFATMLDKCGSNNCKYINNIEYIMHDLANNESDNVHPNASGAAYIAEAVLMALNNATFHYKSSKLTTVTLDGGSAVTGVFYTIDDNVATVSVPNVASMNHTFSFTGGGYYHVGSIADPLFANGFVSNYTSILSNDANAPAAIHTMLSGQDLMAAWPKAGTNTIQGMQITAFSVTGATIWM